MNLTSAQRKRIVSMHREGMKHAAIMRKIGCSYSQVAQALHKARTSGDLPPFERKLILEPNRLASITQVNIGLLGVQLRKIDPETMEKIFMDAADWNYESVAEYVVDLAIEANKTGGKVK